MEGAGSFSTIGLIRDSYTQNEVGRFGVIIPGPVAQSPISTNPGLTLNGTYGVNLGLTLTVL